MAKKKANENGNSAKNNYLTPWKIGTAIFTYIKPFIEDLGQILNKNYLDYKMEDTDRIVPCSKFAHKKITTKDWKLEKHISWSTFRQRVEVLEVLKIISRNEKNFPPLIRLKINKDLAHFYKQNRDEWDGNSTFRNDHIKNIALDLFEKFISSFKKANKAIDKKLNLICFNLLLSFDDLYLNSKYKEILVKNSGKNDAVIKGAIESFGSFWIPIMKDIKSEKERNILISKIENYLQKTIEILEKGEIKDYQNLVVDNKIKNNESKFIKTEDLVIKDEKLNKNNSKVLDMKDEVEVVDAKGEDEDEDDEPIKSKTSINKSWINEIMKAEIKEDYKKNDNNINLVREKSKNVSSETITVQEYLQKFHEYKIYLPFFQRNYTWDPGLIANFFDLIFKEFDTKEDFLFLNTIIFAEKKASEGFWIVDGQQRTVSILLILISILKMASHPDENIFLEQPSIYQTISKILENFSKNNSQYTPLLNFLKNNEKMDNTIFSRNIQKILKKLLEIKTNKNSVDWINDFTNFILKRILLTLIRISEIKDEQFAKLFISINVQSKPIDVVDLITSRVNEESQQEQIPYVKLIQQYFYYGGKKENKDKLGAFLQNQQYFIKDEFNTQNTENNLFSLYQQLDNLLNKWTNNKPLTKETLETFIKKILVFEYAYVGNINFLLSQKDINDTSLELLIQKFKDTIHRNELAFINLQINMISKKGANNPYSLIIESVINKFGIFDDNLNLIMDKENLELFSSVLFQIEKSKIIYYSNFRGRSLRKPIYTMLSQQKNNPSFLKNDNELYHKLVESPTNGSDDLNFKKFIAFTENEDKSDNNFKKNIILRVRISLRKNGEIHPKYKKNKHFETEFTSQLRNLHNNIDDPISVDHFFPQNPSKDYNIGFLINNDKSYKEKYNKIVQKIGNLILLHKDTNSRKQNKNSEPICQNVQDVLIQGTVGKNENSKLESLCNKGLYYEIDPTDKNHKNLEKYKEDFEKIEDLINKRTEQIFEIYFEIFFGKKEKTK